MTKLFFSMKLRVKITEEAVTPITACMICITYACPHKCPMVCASCQSGTCYFGHDRMTHETWVFCGISVLVGEGIQGLLHRGEYIALMALSPNNQKSLFTQYEYTTAFNKQSIEKTYIIERGFSLA